MRYHKGGCSLGLEVSKTSLGKTTFKTSKSMVVLVKRKRKRWERRSAVQRERSMFAKA